MHNRDQHRTQSDFVTTPVINKLDHWWNENKNVFSQKFAGGSVAGD